MKSSAESADSPMQTDEQSQAESQERVLAEWISFGIAAAILLVLVGLILYNWFTIPQGPPVIAIAQVGTIRSADNQFYLPFEVANRGGSTATMVRVQATLRIDDAVVEEVEQEFDFLAAGTRAQGAFIFRRNPRAGEVTLQALSYQEP